MPAVDAGAEDWHLKVRTGKVIWRSPSITLDDADAKHFRTGTIKYQSGEQYSVPDVHLACLHDSQLHNGSSIVLSHRNMSSLAATVAKEGTVTKGILDRLKFTPQHKLSGDYAFLSHPWGNAYYHWLIELLPRLALIEASPEMQSLPLIVPPKLSAFQTDSLRMAGVSPDRLVHVGHPTCTIDRLFVPGEFGRSGNPSPEAVGWLREKFLGRGKASERMRRLYITRRDAGKRRVLNEPEVIEFLRGHGFEVVCPGDYSFAQQVALFSDVDVVVAPHGAGIANMAFAPPGARLLEFFGSSYINGCYWALANICGHHHAALVAPTKTLDYSVSLNRTQRLLEKFLASTAK